MRVDYGPRDLCPLGHGPMWYSPFADEHACQLPTCVMKTPVYAHQVNAFDERYWYAQRFAVTPPRNPFLVTMI